MKTFFIVVGVLVVLIGGGMLLRIAFFPVNTASKLIDTAYDAQNKVLNADNAIYNYEWFKQKHADIEASKKQLVNARATHEAFVLSAGPRNDPNTGEPRWSFEDKNEDARLRAVVLGLENHLQSQIGDYNARASMATRNIFEDSVLPDYIDALTFIRQ